MKLINQLIKKLDKIIDLLTAEKEEREEKAQQEVRAEKERLLMEYARKHNKRFPSPRIHTTRELKELPVQGARDAIPYGLDEADKEILKMWYENSDNRTR